MCVLMLLKIGGTEDTAQLIECLLNTCKPLGLNISVLKAGMFWNLKLVVVARYLCLNFVVFFLKS